MVAPYVSCHTSSLNQHNSHVAGQKRSREYALAEKKEAKCHRIAKEITPLVEMPHHEAYLLGLEHRRIQKMHAIKHNGFQSIADANFVLKNAIHESMDQLDKTHKGIVENIIQNYGNRIGNQFKELLLILKKHKLIHRTEGKAILVYAHEIINTFPSLNKTASLDPSHEFENVNALLLHALNEFQENKNNEDPEELDISLDLAYLLLALDSDLKSTISVFNQTTFVEKNKALELMANAIIKKAEEQIFDKQWHHKELPLQNSEEAMLITLSKELAKLLLLSTGGINTGLAEILFDKLLPKKYADIIAIQDIQNILASICQSEELQDKIRLAQAPLSENLDTAFAMRIALSIPSDEKLTDAHARIFLLSALLSHLRQAKAGTCFAISIIIKACNEQLSTVIDDLIECIAKGSISREKHSVPVEIPFRAFITPENLDKIITVEKNGIVKKIEKYGKGLHYKGIPIKNKYYLYDAPGIQSLFFAMNIQDGKLATLQTLEKLPQTFTIKQFIDQLAEIALTERQETSIVRRSWKEVSKEQLIIRGRYAFALENQNALVRGYDHVLASLADYFSENEMMPRWVFESVEELLLKEASNKGLNTFHLKAILKNSCLAMLARMKYLYNPFFDDQKILFDDGNYGIREHATYGYELMDMGLPSDFIYDDSLYMKLKKEASYIPVFRFANYKEISDWKVVNDAKKFKAFILDVFEKTTHHLSKDKTQAKEFYQCYQYLDSIINQANFEKKLLEKIFNLQDQKKKLNQNPFTLETTPWKLRWGGSNEVVFKDFHGFNQSLTQFKEFNGSQKEVLAHCINYIKKQPQHIFEDYENNYQRILVSSPVHAFIFTPGEPSFKSAWQSPLSASEYIDRFVIEPGQRIANQRLNIRVRKALIEFVANQEWFSRAKEQDDFERLQLTDTSKHLFDEYILNHPEIWDLTPLAFANEVKHYIFLARSKDPILGVRNSHWEKRYAQVLKQKFDSYSLSPHVIIPKEIGEDFIQYAKNHLDTNKLSPQGVKNFSEIMESQPLGLTIPEFRNKILETASAIHTTEKGILDKRWKHQLAPALDSKIFKLLSKSDQTTLIQSGIVPFDSNWCTGINDIHFMFTINPGTASLELCCYTHDKEKLSFMGQSDWFPLGKKAHWSLPDNYRVYAGAPLFKKDHH